MVAVQLAVVAKNLEICNDANAVLMFRHLNLECGLPPAHTVLAAPLLPLPPVEHQGGHLVVVAQGAARHVHQVTVLSVNLSRKFAKISS